jgi:hypothetical protein
LWLAGSTVGAGVLAVLLPSFRSGEVGWSPVPHPARRVAKAIIGTAVLVVIQ